MDIQSSSYEYQLLGDVGVVRLKLPRISEEENLEQLHDDWNSLIEKCSLRAVVIDLASVRYMTSAAIGILISLHRQMVRQQGQLILCSLQRDVACALETSHLLSYFRVTPTQDDAITQVSTQA